jgi:phosphopantetheine adenylyltransferase
MLKEVFRFGGDVKGLMPPNILKRLRGRINESQGDSA